MTVPADVQITEAVPTPRRGSWRHWFSISATAILVPVLLLVVAEVLLRICGVGTPTGAMRPCTDQGRPAYCDNQFFAAPFFPPGMYRTPRPYVIPATKAPGTYRIFVLGESVAWGDPDPTYGFARYLEVMLRERFPQVKFEVVNASITAINSHVLLPMVKDLAQYQPDLFVIYTGNTEVVGPFGPGTVLTPWDLSLPAIRARIALNSTRLGQLVGNASGGTRNNAAEWRGMEMFLERQVRADSPQMRPVYGNFAANLRDIGAVARRSGSHVLISTVATNLKDCAPFASLHREGIRPDELNSWEGLVQHAAALENAGSYSEALQLYFSAADIDPQYAELQFRIARCLWAIGDFAGAKERFVRAQDLDTLRFRADSKLNDVIRTVAGEGSGIGLVDAAAVLAAESPHEVPGGELFYEHVHTNPRGTYLLARAFFGEVVRILPSELQRGATGADVISQEDCERLLAFTPYDRVRVAGLVLSKLERPPFTNQLNHSEEVLRLKGQTEGVSLEYSDIVAEYQWAIMRNPQDRLLHLNYGFLLHRYDPAAAEKELRAALPYDNAPVLCNWRKFD
ncbi:MAG TPA: tetratricopeptide repeat protein [Candidatus Sulfotelmatobacter sp.]|nr:tetratricopeptide repeat protein [Candidatus Sulfotelmatobacter sp.]